MNPLNPYQLLALPAFYRWFQSLTWSERSTDFLTRYGKPLPGEKVLDIGCGPGDRLRRLPEVNYTGFDVNPAYIASAQKSLGSRGRFVCGDVASFELKSERGSYDLVLAIGVIHHVDDVSASRLFALAREMLKPGGRLITADPAFVPEQSRWARFMISRDRGQYVRPREQYMKLASATFTSVASEVRHDLLRIPWTILLLHCRK